jgi:heme/copper-type cytochrome/quinol oxidase subunit 4
MASIFLIAGVISITFLLVKFLEMRYIEKESKPLKFLIRDALVVYFSVIIANFIMEQLNTAMESSGGGKKITPVFTDNPTF